jgi:uncharacterized BrkB/YihY/UPF0761 family membrane protein
MENEKDIFNKINELTNESKFIKKEVLVVVTVFVVLLVVVSFFLAGSSSIVNLPY